MNKTYDESGKRRLSFSFGRLITNAVPNFTNSSGLEMTTGEMDILFFYQLNQANPKILNPNSLNLSNTIPSEKTRSSHAR